MQIAGFYNYTPMIKKTTNQSFKASAQDLNDMFDESTSILNEYDKARGKTGYNYFVTPTIKKPHQTWDETNGFKNFKIANSVNRIFTGYTLVKTPEKIKELKDTYGIKTIIDLVGYNEYKRQCEDAGINYFGDFNLYYNMYNTAPFLSQEDYLTLNRNNGSKEELIKKHKNATLKFNENLNKLIDVLDGNYIYMGCDHGHSRTNDVILLVNEHTKSQKLSLNEDDVMNIDEKRYAINQFERNLKLYSEN